MSKQYTDFIAGLEGFGMALDDKGLSLVEKKLVDTIYTNTLRFIEDNQLAAGSQLAEGLESFTTPITMMNTNVGLANIGTEAIVDLCRASNIPEDQLYSAVRSVAFCISNKNAQSYGSHFDSSVPSVESLGDMTFKKLDDVIGPMSLASITENATSALEAFGKDIDKLTTDIKMNIAITLLKFHKNIIDRLMNRKPCTGDIVQFQVPYTEVYDLEKSGDTSSAVRNKGNHRVPFIDLYKNPETANTAAKKIEVLKVNDIGDPVLVDDGKVAFNKDVNLFDLAIDPTKIGSSHVDYTDLVGEGVLLDTIYITITKDNGADPATTEVVGIPVRARSSARLQMRNNARDSADRNCILNEGIKFDASTPKADGTASTILATFTAGAFIRVNLKVSAEINLKTSDMSAQGTVRAELATITGEDPIPAIATAFSKLTFTPTAYSVDARYSEENMRKTTSAIRMHQKPTAYAIPVGKNVIVDYSLSQVQPDAVLNTVGQALALGNDYRAISVIKETISMVFDRIRDEQTAGIFLDHQDRVGFDFVAGMQSYPAIYKDTLDLATLVQSAWSGQILGDIRGAVEKYLLEVFAKLYNDSMYLNVLDRGEKPHFKVLTSGPIMSAVLNVPHYHDHLNTPNTADGDKVEYRRILPDGTILEVITTTWTSMVDQMLVIPYRPSAPESEFAFGQNCDRGTFVAHYVPTQFAGTHRRIATNSREIPIVTNPLAALITVSNVSALFNGLATLGVVNP